MLCHLTLTREAVSTANSRQRSRLKAEANYSEPAVPDKCQGSVGFTMRLWSLICPAFNLCQMYSQTAWIWKSELLSLGLSFSVVIDIWRFKTGVHQAREQCTISHALGSTYNFPSPSRRNCYVYRLQPVLYSLSFERCPRSACTIRQRHK